MFLLLPSEPVPLASHQRSTMSRSLPHHVLRVLVQYNLHLASFLPRTMHPAWQKAPDGISLRLPCFLGTVVFWTYIPQHGHL